jgi:tRNA nucleotidyltransferase (CCA-adding enzyme)
MWKHRAGPEVCEANFGIILSAAQDDAMIRGMEDLQTYLVGGAVRDRLLGLAPGDRDFVVVGATPEAMRARGFRAVGRDFPVFLHPRTGEEYALARTERKSGRGYRGFVVDADPSVTLEEDLARRDFTINAIAEDAAGHLVDPFGGARDIEARVLRHVGPAFVEDPLRVLRAARFLARFAPLGFTLAPETAALMGEMAASGELAELTPERVWQELARALASPRPSAFLRTLRDAGALAVILPEVDALYGVPQRAEFHPEIDTGVHVELVCDMAATLAPGEALIGFAALTHDLGKALTPDSVLPKHLGHEHAGLAPLRALCDRLKVPSAHRQLAEMACREHLNVHRVFELRAKTVHDLLARCDGFRQPERIAALALVCECDKRGRAGLQDEPYPQRAELLRLQAAALAVRAVDVAREGLAGPALGEALRKARIRAIQASRSEARAQSEDADEDDDEAAS